MQQNEINRAVARATGETVSTIKRLGFLLAELPADCDDDCEEYSDFALDQPVVDWETLPLTQRVAVAAGRRERVPACC